MVSLAYGGKTPRKLRNERFEAQPESGEPMRFAGMQRKHGVVVDARFLDVRELRQEEAEGHDISPCVVLNAVRGKPADTEVGRVTCAATDVYSLSSGKSKGERHMG